MKFLPDKVEKYAEEHSTPETIAEHELNRQTHLKVLLPQMLSGHLQGQFLTMISRMIRPKRILEIGTYTGYSAMCMAKGLQDKGILHTIDINIELEDIAKKYWDEEGIKDKIKLHTGDATEIIPELDEVFDLTFIDADKQNYSKYYDLVLPKTRRGGFILADNVLWGGRVLEDKKDKDTRAIDEFNKKITEDDRVENVLTPIRDGVMVIWKR